MTAEERDRMNALCLQIQQEKNYQKFEELARELHDVVARKERKFPERKSLDGDPKLNWMRRAEDEQNRDDLI